MLVKISSLLKGSSFVARHASQAHRAHRSANATRKSDHSTMGTALPELRRDEGL